MIPLRIENISKSFQQQDVLKSCSLTVEKGEIVGLIGLNGMGKTTLIKILLDLMKPDQGNAWFFGERTCVASSRRHLAYLPEKFMPSPFLKGQEFLKLALAGVHKPYIPDEAYHLAKQLALDTEVLTKRIGKYSKGMGQKLGIMAAFLSTAPLLILDEPMSGLDPQARVQLKSLLQDYSARGNSIFFSSHILADIEEICHRIAILHHGELLFVGTPTRFRETYPGSSLEQAFLGAISTAS